MPQWDPIPCLSHVGARPAALGTHTFLKGVDGLSPTQRRVVVGAARQHARAAKTLRLPPAGPLRGASAQSDRGRAGDARRCHSRNERADACADATPRHTCGVSEPYPGDSDDRQEQCDQGFGDQRSGGPVGSAAGRRRFCRDAPGEVADVQWISIASPAERGDLTNPWAGTPFRNCSMWAWPCVRRSPGPAAEDVGT